MADSGSKTEKATPKKRKDERKKGNVFSSRDLVTVFSILVTFFMLKLMFPWMYSNIDFLIQRCVEYAGESETITIQLAHTLFRECVATFARMALPVLLVSTLVSVVVTGAQTKFLFAHEALKPKFNRLNPLEGFKRMLSLRSLVELIKGLIKISIIGVILYRFFLTQITPLTKTLFMNLTQSTTYILNSVFDMIIRICIIFVFVAALDYMYQRWDYERRIKMSKHEVKEEYKQLEGDPKVKARIKDVQRKFAMSRMMQAVPTADVIIKNPTHFAVALKYDIEKDLAPVIVAKGQDQLALRIIKIAEQHNIYITENKPLAQALYKAVELNREIPMEFYNTVAEILAELYRIKNKTL